MVFFTCNACGASLKKNQVEKHYQNECRNCEVLSCMDCGKDFYGDDYAAHIKCVSEAEKYQGALYKDSGKSGGAKGEKKQQEWLERVRDSVQSAEVNPRISRLLEKISEFPNIPRKKSKFENFVSNSCQVRDSHTLSQLWEIFSRASKPAQSVATGGPDDAPNTSPTVAAASADAVEISPSSSSTDDKSTQNEHCCGDAGMDEPVENGVDDSHSAEGKGKEGKGKEEKKGKEKKEKTKKKKKHKRSEKGVEEDGAEILEWYEDHTPDPSSVTEDASNLTSVPSVEEGGANTGRKRKHKHKHTDCSEAEAVATAPKKAKAEELVTEKRKKHKHKKL